MDLNAWDCKYCMDVFVYLYISRPFTSANVDESTDATSAVK